MAEITVSDLLEAGAHFGHQTHRWNPRMAPFIFGERGGVHIIDLEQTLGYLHEAQKKAREITAAGGDILFVGTKRQGKEAIKAAAERAGQPYVTERWLGGLLTNWQTIEGRIKLLNRLAEEKAQNAWERLPKKEVARKQEELDRLQNLLGGLKDIQRLPQAMFIADIVREDLALAEGRRLGIPIIGVIDSNADPRGVDYPIPANDDAIKAITVVADAIAEAAAIGKEEHAQKPTETGAEEVPA